MLHIEIELLFSITTSSDMGDTVSEKLMNDIMEGCQEMCQDVGCLPNLIR